MLKNRKEREFVLRVKIQDSLRFEFEFGEAICSSYVELVLFDGIIAYS